MWKLVPIIVVAGCVHSTSLVCEDGRICPADQTCDNVHHLCVFPDQLESCKGRSDGMPCKINQTDATETGECVDNVCIAPLCGDGLVTAEETCDGTIPTIGTCVDFNYDYGSLSCSSLCGDGLDTCHQLGWKLVALPGFGNVNGIAEDGGVVWVANQFGVFKKANDTWSPIGQVTATSVFGLAISAVAGHVFVVGKSNAAMPIGYALVFDGTTWTEYPVGNSNTVLSGVWARSATDAYAVGRGAGVIHFDGVSWTPMTTPGSAGLGLEAIHGTATEAVAVGQDGGVPVVYRNTGGGWAALGTYTGTQPLHGVWERAPNDIWVVGDNSTAAHWDGVGWRQLGPAGVPVTLKAVSGRSATEVYAVGDAGGPSNIFRYDGVGWLPMASPISEQLLAVHVGATGIYAARGANGFLEYRGAGWGDTNAPVKNAIHGLWASGTDYQIAVGDGCELQEYRNGSWTSTTVPTGPVANCNGCLFELTAWAADKDDVYVGGPYGRLYHRRGTTWGCDVPAAAAMWTFGVWGSSATDVYSVGQDNAGTVAYFTHTTGIGTWTDLSNILPSGPDAPKRLLGIWGASATDIFIVGEHGAIIHYNGTSATRMPTPPTVTGNLLAVWGSSGTDVYAVGDQSVVLHYDGTSWTQITSLPIGLSISTTANFSDVHGTGPDDVWVAGGRALLHWNGTAWNQVKRIDSGMLERVFAIDGHVYLGGDFGPGQQLIGTLAK